MLDRRLSSRPLSPEKTLGQRSCQSFRAAKSPRMYSVPRSTGTWVPDRICGGLEAGPLPFPSKLHDSSAHRSHLAPHFSPHPFLPIASPCLLVLSSLWSSRPGLTLTLPQPPATIWNQDSSILASPKANAIAIAIAPRSALSLSPACSFCLISARQACPVRLLITSCPRPLLLFLLPRAFCRPSSTNHLSNNICPRSFFSRKRTTRQVIAITTIVINPVACASTTTSPPHHRLISWYRTTLVDDNMPTLPY